MLRRNFYGCIEYHSDGAVNSYTTGTEMKDTFRADVDVHHLSCCRPESAYHPDKLQTCIVCRDHAGQPHGTCPLVLYPRPEKPLAEHPYMGPRPAVRECSLYNVRKPTCFIVDGSVYITSIMFCEGCFQWLRRGYNLPLANAETLRDDALHLSVCLFLRPPVAKMPTQKRGFMTKLSSLELAYMASIDDQSEVIHGLFKEPILGPLG